MTYQTQRALHHADTTDAQRRTIANAIKNGTKIAAATFRDGQLYVWVTGRKDGYHIDRNGAVWPA